MGALSKAERAWAWLSCTLAERPLQFIGYTIGLLIVIVALATAVKSTEDNTKDINKNRSSIAAINAALCNTPNQGKTIDVEQCQLLFTKLLQNPTDAQVTRLRQLVHEGK